jgi:hypothetical protein
LHHKRGTGQVETFQEAFRFPCRVARFHLRKFTFTNSCEEIGDTSVKLLFRCLWASLP